jgi:hypothetical protein
MNNRKSYAWLMTDKSDPVRGTAIIFLWAVVIVALLLGDPNQQARSQSTSQPAAEATCK